MVNNKLNMESNLIELTNEEMLEVDGGNWLAIGGAAAALNELWKFSGGFVEGAKEGWGW